MCVALADRVCAGRFIVFAGQKAVDDTRRNTLRAHHYRHRRGKILAVPLLHVEDKVRERVGTAGFQIQRVDIVFTQISFDRSRRVITIPHSRTLDYAVSKRTNARAFLRAPLPGDC